MRKLSSALHKHKARAHMNIAKNLIAAAAIFGVGLFLGCIITAKALEIGTQPTIEKPFGAEKYAMPVIPPLPHFSTPKTSHAVK